MEIKELLILAKKKRSESTYASKFNEREEERQKLFDSTGITMVVHPLGSEIE